MYNEMLNENPNWDGNFEDKKKYLVYTGSSYEIPLVMTGETIKSILHPGDCDDDVKRAMEIPEIKEQLEKIDRELLDKWWDEDMFIDDSPEEHKNASLEKKLSWVVFDSVSNAVDGYCWEYQPNSEKPLMGEDVLAWEKSQTETI